MSLEKRCRNCQFFRSNRLQITATPSIRGKCKADYVDPIYGLQTKDFDVNPSNLCLAWDPYNQLLFKPK